MHDLNLAYKFYSEVNPQGFLPGEFKKILKNLTKLELNDDQVAVLFELFDADGNGRLDASEFYKVLKNRVERGLNTPRDVGVAGAVKRVLEALKSE